jgi:hypothetical protein
MRDFIHIRWLDSEVKMQMLTMDGGDFESGYAALFETILRALGAIGCRAEFDRYFPALDSLTVQFYKTKTAEMDTAELPPGLDWRYAAPITDAEALRDGVTYSIEVEKEAHK